MDKWKKISFIILMGIFCVIYADKTVLASGFENFVTPFEGLVIPPFSNDTGSSENAGNTEVQNKGPAEKEPNDDIKIANRIKVGETVSGTTGAGNDTDIFVFTLKKTSYINVSLTHEPMEWTGNMWFAYLRDDTGKLVNKTTDNVFSAAENTYAESKALKLKRGTYYLTVVGYVPAVGQTYKVTVNEITADKPTRLAAQSADYQKITLTWNPVPGAYSYKIYRSTVKSGRYKQVASLKGNAVREWSDSKLATGKTYYYKMKAVVYTGKKQTSGYSKAVSAKTVPGTASLITFVSDKNITLRWTKIAGASGYEIVRSTKASSTYRKIKTIKKGAVTSYTDGKKKSGKTYYYKIRAYRTVNGKKIYGKYSNIAFGILN